METIGYCVRVQALEGYSEKIRALTFQEDYTGLLAVRHLGNTKENPHYHIVVKTGVQPQTFRVRMKKLFPDGKGNGHMSIVPWDGDVKALSYLFHEEPDVTPHIRKGITDEFLDKIRSTNVEILSKVKDAKNRSSHTLLQDATEHFTQFHKDRPIVRISPLDIAEWMILHALRSGKYVPQAWLLRAMVSSVMFSLCGGEEEAEKDYARILAANLLG